MVNYKKHIKSIIANIIYYTGIYKILLRYRYNDNGMVLMYHRVLNSSDIEQADSHKSIIIEKNNFEKQIEFLKTNFRVLSIQEFSDKLRDDKLGGTCLITFDDGWVDNYINAMPLMGKENLEAVVFLTYEYINTNRIFWREEITSIVKAIHGRCIKNDIENLVRFGMPHREKVIDLLKSEPGNLKHNLSAFLEFLKNLKNMDHIKILRMLEQVDPGIGRRKEPQFLNYNEIREMQKNHIDMGSHGMSHTLLTSNHANISYEIGESKRLLEKQLGCEIISFSYPNGEYDEKIKKKVEELNYQLAFTTNNGVVNNSEPYQINRINISESNSPNIRHFICRLLGIW